MKGLKVLALGALVLCSVPRYAAAEISLKAGDIQVVLSSFTWGLGIAAATNGPAMACATHEAKFSLVPLSQNNPLPSPSELAVMGLCASHKTEPAMTVEINGQKHVLQNASITSCPNNVFTLHFERCVTHSGGALASMVNPNVHPEGNVKILIGLTPRPESFNFASFQFQGPTAAVFKQRDAAASSFFQQAFQTKQKFPSLTVERKAGRGQQEYFKVTMSDVLVSSYQVNGDGSATIGLSFAKADGSVRGFQDVH